VAIGNSLANIDGFVDLINGISSLGKLYSSAKTISGSSLSCLLR